MARTNAVVRKASVGVPATVAPVVGVASSPAAGVTDRVARSVRVPTGAIVTPTAGVASTQPAGALFTVPAFPGAEGFAATTVGGRGGQVVVVTNLNDSGAGSFRDALMLTAPRIVVFRVSGVINLSSNIQLHPNNSYLTVLGQTSPGGITISGGSIANYAPDDGNQPIHDLIFRYVRIRRQDGGDNFAFNWANNFILDHCDGSGSADETFDFDSSHDFTLQWCSYLNGNNTVDQGKGMLIAYAPTQNISIHGNLSAHFAGRNGAQMHWAPIPAAGSVDPLGPAIDIRNNVIYPNTEGQQIWRADDLPPGGVRLNMVNNYSKVGPTFAPGSPGPQLMGGYSGNLFVSGNVYVGGTDGQSSTIGAAHSFPAVTTTSAAQAYADVLDFGGSWPPDAMLVRTKNEVRDGRGVLDRWNDPLNTFAVNAAPTPPVDSNSDGLPDSWGPLNAAAINPVTHYANVEDYANSLAAAIQSGQTTLLEQKAALLGPNQSILVASTPITTFPDGDLNYGASAVYDEIRREIRFIGKKASSSFHLVCWSYSLANGFVMNPFPLSSWLNTNQLGHGYDLNAVDPDTGDHYFRPSNHDGTVEKWTAATGAWSVIPSPSGTPALGSLVWAIVGGVGRLVVCDAASFAYWNGSSWVAINGNSAGFGSPGNDYHTLSEYNDTSKVLMIGGGNGSGTLRKWDFSLGSPTLTSISSPSFPVGAASPSQGPLCSVPDDDKILAHQKNSSNWSVYDISAGGSWTTLTQSSGAGASPQTGTPNLGYGGDGNTVATPIRLPGRTKITAWLHTNDTQGYRVELWLYKAA